MMMMTVIGRLSVAEHSAPRFLEWESLCKIFRVKPDSNIIQNRILVNGPIVLAAHGPFALAHIVKKPYCITP
jgi:hypothetical protein